MSWINSIVSFFSNLSDWFYSIYLAVHGWIWPFNLVASPFYWVSSIFASIAWGFYYFNEWVDYAAAWLSSILTWDNIKNLILGWLRWIGDLGTIFYHWWQNVVDVVASWWGNIKLVVQSWIGDAGSLLKTWVNTLFGWVIAVKDGILWLIGHLPTFGEIIDWFGDCLGWLVAKLLWLGFLPVRGILSLINSTLKEWFPFYASLAELWGSVQEFIIDPLEWSWTHFVDWFLGPEE